MKNNFRCYAGNALLVLLMVLSSVSVAQVSAIYGGGNIYRNRDYTIDELKNSGFNTVIVWTIHIAADGDLGFNGEFPLVENGEYVGDLYYPEFPADMLRLKTAPTSINRIEFGLSAWGSGTFDAVEDLYNSEGFGPGTTLYENFSALRDAIPAIDAFNNDDEGTYDVESAVAFTRMLADLGFQNAIVPYTNSSFWSSLVSQVNSSHPGNIDRTYLQVYAGGSGNNPCSSTWDFGIPVIPGLWGEGSSDGNYSPSEVESQISSWNNQCGIGGGFMWLYGDFDNSPQVAAFASAINNSFVANTTPGNASNPDPSNGTSNVSTSTILSWTAGSNATSSDVYFGTDSSPDNSEFMGSTGAIGYDPGLLQTNTTYYWRVDEVNGTGTSTGSVWSFTTEAVSPPITDFSASTAIVTQGESVSFTDQSTYGPTSWSWTFEGGTPASSTSQNPVVTYNTPGTFDVTLTSSNSAGNSTETKTDLILVLSDDPSDYQSFQSGRASVSMPDANSWTSVNFSTTMSTVPIVAAGPATYNGTDPATLKVRNVTASGFEVQVDEWDYLDGVHNNAEDIHYMAVVPGNHDLGGLGIEAGSVSITDSWTTQNLGQSFASVPVVLAVRVTDNESSATAIRLQNISPNSFEIRLQEEEASAGTHASETVHYIAFEKGAGTFNGRAIEVGSTGNTVGDSWYVQSFTNSFSGSGVLANIQTNVGGNPVSLRQRDLTSTSVSFLSQEEASLDSEVGHDPEEVGWVRIAEIEYVDGGASNPPVSDFTASATTIEEGESITFTDLSTNIPTSWSWTFSGGSPASSTSQNPMVTYSTAGTYNVTLTAANADGSDTETKSGYITVNTSTSGPSLPTFYTDCNYGGGSFSLDVGSYNRQALNQVDGFSDNTVSSLRVPVGYSVTVYQNGQQTGSSGTFTADDDCLDDDGLDEMISAILVEGGSAVGAPVADFSANATSVNEGTTINFSDASSNNPTSWSWTFSGGSPASSTSQNPIVTYNTAGTYDVTLIATNTDGSDTETKSGYITVTVSGGGGASLPTFYIDCEYGGGSFSLDVGSYNRQALNSVSGFVNNAVSSIEVPVGYTVTIYDRNLAGTSATFSSDDNCLSDDGVDNLLTSVEVISTGARIANETASLLEEQLDSELGQGFAIYPNPFKDVVKINLPIDSEYKMFSIIDLSGRELMRREITSDELTIDLTSFAQRSILLLKLKGPLGSELYKLISE